MTRTERMTRGGGVWQGRVGTATGGVLRAQVNLRQRTLTNLDGGGG